MYKSVIYLIFIIFLLSCGEKNTTTIIPANIFPEKKMTQIITDIHLAEAEINLTMPAPKLTKIHGDTVIREPIDFQKIFDKNKITKSQYDTSISFYINHPDLLDTVYSQVLTELSKMQRVK